MTEPASMTLAEALRVAMSIMDDRASWLEEEEDDADSDTRDASEELEALNSAYATLETIAADMATIASALIDNAERFTCTEAEAVARLLDGSETFLAEHAAGDEEGDDHYDAEATR